MDGLPVSKNPMNFKTAIAPLAISAAQTTPRLAAIPWVLDWRRQRNWGVPSVTPWGG
jgi:hypothetical protein